jgi:long-chain acyl-CoA synthetase
MSRAPYRSFADLVVHRIATTPDREAFRYPTGPGWASLTWRETGDRVRAIACGLRSLGLQNEQRCGLLAATSVDWVLVDFGIMCAAGATTTIYPSMTPDECAYILNDSECQFAFVEDASQLEKLARKRMDLPHLKRVFVMNGPVASTDWVGSVAELSERGRGWDAANPGEFDAIAQSPTPQSLATLLYTSGTTGRPKGVELTHDCWLYEAEAIEALGLLTADDVHYLWLPLSHSFGKVLEAAQARIGFVTAIDGRIDKMVENLAEVRPTFVAAVPRVFEKVHNKVVMGAQDAGGLKLKIFTWAMDVGRQVSGLTRAGRRPSGWLAMQHGLAEKLVYAKLKERFGGRLRFFISGSAPLSLEVAEFFHAAGILIAEGYGLTETSAATFVNRPEKYKLGTVGLPVPGTEVRIAPEDGEVLLRGRGVMRGYHKLPEATRECLSPDGWLSTGDIGFVDADGFLKITDRKKDLIKTSGGKYVAPQALEGRFKALCPYVSQIVVHGNNRNFCSALITLDDEAIRKWGAENGVPGTTVAEIVASTQARTLIQGYVDQLNGLLASYETIKRFAILPADFTVESGELTASLKVKRKAVEQKFKHVLDSFYTDAGTVGSGL